MGANPADWCRDMYPITAQRILTKMRGGPTSEFAQISPKSLEIEDILGPVWGGGGV